MISNTLKAFVWLLLCPIFFGCGVKGDPVPPERPAFIGRGQPTYDRASRKLKLPTIYEKNSWQDEAPEDSPKDEEEDEKQKKSNGTAK